MAPAVPFALLGVVQLVAVATWLALAAAAGVAQLRRPTTPLLVLGCLGMAAAEAVTSLRFSAESSDPLAIVRLAALGLIAVGMWRSGTTTRHGAADVDRSRSGSPSLPAVVAPLGAMPGLAAAGAAAGVLAAVAAVGLRRGRDGVAVATATCTGLLLTAAAAGLAGPAQHQTNAALGVLAARAAASAAFVVLLVLLARHSLLGKLVGAIVAGVVAMAVGAVAVVGIGVAGDVQHDQSQRLLSVAQAQQQSLTQLATRAGLFAKVAALCPSNRQRCVTFLDLFASDPSYFAAIAVRGEGVRTVAPTTHALSHADLLQLAGSRIVRASFRRTATTQAVASGPVLLDGSPLRLAVVAAVPGRPAGASQQSAPSYVALYGIGVVDAALRTDRSQTGYDVSVLVGDRVAASSLRPADRGAVADEARSGDISSSGPTTSEVVAASGHAPTVAFVPVTEAGNDDVRIATLAVSQPASVALAAQQSVLRRLVLTALVVLVVVALLALAMAQRITGPVRRLTLAAGRVRRGDLEASSHVTGVDEVGELALTFDEMTASLRGLTGDLRDAAEQETGLRARLETVVGSMTDGLVVMDADGVVTSANPTAVDLLGATSQDDVVGHAAGDVLELVDDDGSLRRDRLAVGPPLDGTLRRPDGGMLPVRMAVAPLADGRGTVVVLADRTREREVDRLKGEFLANVSHELRTPLTPIRGYAELLARRHDLTPQRTAEFVAEILASTQRMHRVVELLVDVAALDAGRVQLQPEAVSVSRLADDRLEAWRASYPDRAADFARRVAPNLPPLQVDRGWLAKALDELADNAVKHAPADSPITIAATRSDDGGVRIAVRDAGPGVDRTRLPELLGDFSQADASATRQTGGLGLGLGFVTRVAQRLGLELSVDTRAGAGSEFALTIPPSAATEVSKRSRPPARHRRTTKPRRTRE